MLRFVDAQGATILTYSELKVWDAEGRNLRARFLAERDAVRLIVDARGARYPVTMDPIAQQAYLKASNTDAGDGFGFRWRCRATRWSSGHRKRTATPPGSTATRATTAQTPPARPMSSCAAARPGPSRPTSKPPTPTTCDWFGYSVAVSGDTVVVGAYGEDSNATGVNGDQSDNSAPTPARPTSSCATATTWTQQAYLKASNTGGG